MLTLETIEAKHRVVCSCCGEHVYTCEKFFQVMNNGKPVRGERYCTLCEEVAYQNYDFDCDDGERMLRSMEDFAAYKAAGCTSEYWDDRDAGYAH